MSLGLLLWYAPGTAFRRAARPRLEAQFPDDVEQVWDATRAWQSRLKPSRPRHSISVNVHMRHLEWSCALYHALKDHGMNLDEAGTLVEAIGADIYEPVTAAMFKLSRLRSAKPARRVKWILYLLTHYFFTAPFIHRHHQVETGVSFDVTVCPLADYFKDQGVPEITPYAACNLDHCLARAAGVELVRTQTLADGSEYCDFRWKFPDTWDAT